MRYRTAGIQTIAKYLSCSHDRKQIWGAVKVLVFQMIYGGFRLTLVADS